MKNEKGIVDLPKARSSKTDKKNQRLQRAAELSRTQTATEIMNDLGISKRTPQRTRQRKPVKHPKGIVDLPKARSAKTEKKNQRLQRAAEMSQTQTVTEIMRELGISQRTLQRYMADPLWQEHGGAPLTFTERGRPSQDTLSASEKRTLTEAHTLHDQGNKWVQVADILEIPIRRLKYLLKKQRAETETT